MQNPIGNAWAPKPPERSTEKRVPKLFGAFSSLSIGTPYTGEHEHANDVQT